MNEENSREESVKIDPEVKKELKDYKSEEEIFGVYEKEGGKDRKVEAIEDWLPEKQDWQAKTRIDKQQAFQFALVRNLPKAYPEVDDLEPFLDGLMTDLEMYLTSVEGQSRQEQASVLTSMFGRASSQTQETMGMLKASILGANEDDD